MVSRFGQIIFSEFSGFFFLLLQYVIEIVL